MISSKTPKGMPSLVHRAAGSGAAVTVPVKNEKDGYKYAQIKADLSMQIMDGQLRPNDRIPSLNEIVSKYNVSKITARRVLNDLVADGLVYANRGRGAFVSDEAARRAYSRSITLHQQLGVVFEHAAGSFMADIILGIDEEAFSHKAQISLSISNNSYEREAQNLHRLVEQGIGKILLFMVLQNDPRCANPNIPLYLRLQEEGIKLLLLACNVPGFAIPSITYDDYNAFRQLVKYFKDEGKQRLAYVTRRDNASTTSERLRGFKDGLLENTLSYRDDRILEVGISSVDSVSEDARDQFAKMLRAGTDVDAVCCSDEMIAAGVFEALDAAGLDETIVVGGMGSARNLHVLGGHRYVLLEDDTYRLGRDAAALMLRGELPGTGETNLDLFHNVIPVPLRVPSATR
jgi:GntR family transcriptional regulator, arabinose operon transcriptional repressor